MPARKNEHKGVVVALAGFLNGRSAEAAIVVLAEGVNTDDVAVILVLGFSGPAMEAAAFAIPAHDFGFGSCLLLVAEESGAGGSVTTTPGAP